LIHPQPDPRLDYAKATYESRYGKIISEWTRDGEKLNFHVTIPPNTMAEIILPGHSLESVFSGENKLTDPFPEASVNGKSIEFTIGSGNYSFTVVQNSPVAD
jgi:alpha-L-rhamnosidase